MTIGEKMHQTLASLEGVKANMKTFALDTQDQNAKQMFSQYSQQLETMCQGLQSRCNYIEQQEPQYKVFQQAQQQQQQQ
ncbi:hypothetical protein JOC37_002324 [Desulfohalotomaculum tongense]|uniref:DUF1657 domain-containing protein n=1 Tax=Desulforadius tongensis TaxID=1216062 RepID=UPI0019595161|nr:DUF1657 domain-containing protein [Desulforadius tongensis]MBM7855902.1 hypothetical protein [Desulforadius tongensis]